MEQFEVRAFAAEMRAAMAGGKLQFDGYGSVTGVPYSMGGHDEVIQRGAFARTLAAGPDVHLLLNHEGLPLARTGVNMTLAEDGKGLRVAAELDPDDPDVQTLKRKLDAGLLDQMSFSFSGAKSEWTDDYSRRTIVDLDINRGDVSIVNQGANPSTSAAMRGRAGIVTPLEVRARAMGLTTARGGKRRGMTLEVARATAYVLKHRPRA